eukprot:CAMPEP_0115703036 /NCGR_PEP_ID=MMETSP0272-20121206/68872_1 /TAXON_ID=71861 /ORGANISM="Scrippsiella trochoidea, Strain CCMP3099" /LENGTH=30 /DNA_ID= /DNA_START= /DNA_END= /DNA_ORIENTATION=
MSHCLRPWPAAEQELPNSGQRRLVQRADAP